MAFKRQLRNGSWEFCFKRKAILSEPVWITFDTEEQGDRYAEKAEALLAKGIVPQEMRKTAVSLVEDLIDLYEAQVRMARAEAEALPWLRKMVTGVKVEVLDYSWVERWVDGMHAAGKAPSTITKRVSALARVVDWAMRRDLLSLSANPLRLLPKGYGSKGFDRNKQWLGERDRRLEVSEEEAIRKVLVKKDERLIFDIALETAMRLGEIFTLQAAQVDLASRTIFLHKTKNGKKRQVPISSVLLTKLQEYGVKSMDSEAYLFPDWWQGGDEDLKDKMGNKLSHLWRARFKKAGVTGLNFHDLRHECTSRLYERTRLTDLQIASITGHTNMRMLQRYANLRGSTLAEGLW